MAVRRVSYAQSKESNLDNNMTELKRRLDERRKSIKGIQVYYTDKRTFTGDFESNWFIPLDEYADICADWDVPDEDEVSFFRFY